MAKYLTMDGNEAVAYIAYRCSEVCAIYPITPSSTMAEWCDEWSAKGIKNLWGTVPSIMEMQSEGGAAGTVHGSLMTGSLTTTFTASQGLLLKIPNMYKIAGELTPAVFHIAARALATHALSIFGDHSDVMSARSTGFAMLCGGSVQEAMDMALIAHASTLEARVPFINFFDGFRTSHEVSKVCVVPEETIREMIDDKYVLEFRSRALNPDKPSIHGTAQNSDVYFQAREASNPYYNATPAIVQKYMDKFAALTGRQYKLFEYVGAADAENVLIIMGSGAEVAHETLDALNAKGAKLGLLKVHLYRPFSAKDFINALPTTTKKIAVLDRTKEPGATGEPLYLDVLSALIDAQACGCKHLAGMPLVIGGRYGLASKDFTPAMVKSVYDNLAQSQPKNHFTVGINDDVTGTSLPFDPSFSTEPENVIRAMFYGLGSDGTVGANKNTIKIIGEEQYAQGYFVYDSKKSGSMTVSHVRFGPNPIRSCYLISKANFVACHQPTFPDRYDMAANLVPGGTLLMNTPFGTDKVWDTLPAVTQKGLIEKKAKLFIIDANKVAQATGMGSRINTIMQVCFFSLSGVLPKDVAIEKIKASIRKTYGKKGDEVVAKNIAAVDKTLECLYEVQIPNTFGNKQLLPPVTADATPFVKNILGPIIAGNGENMPVSAFTADGSFPTDTSRYEKRDLALAIPAWDPSTCIQCLKCASICPHACIRGKVYDAAELAKAPATFKSADSKIPEFKGKKFTLQVSVHDCTGCGLCVESCPAKSKTTEGAKAINMVPQMPLRESEGANWDFFLTIPETDRTLLKNTQTRYAQLMRPLFEFSGACAGCGETPYVKLLTQLFGDRLAIANATGCSSIYGANLPTTPYAQDINGRGPAWANSLFEDNAEFGLGYRLSFDKQAAFACELLDKVAPIVADDQLVADIKAHQEDNCEKGIANQRARVATLKQKLAGQDTPDAKMLLSVADALVHRSVWILGGDGWAYDIGYGGLDHVLASGKNVNILVLDTEVYSNTGGQSSKSTPRGAVAKFAAAGKRLAKKDLGMIAMSYGNVYVATVSMGANDNQVLKAMVEAENHKGVSIIIAYSHCISHGIDMKTGAQHQKALVDAGSLLLYRYNPALKAEGKNPLQLDSKPNPNAPSLVDVYGSENRFRMLKKSKPEVAQALAEEAQADAAARYAKYQYLSQQQ